jgi:DNA-directed RNA polymerase specialized sigma24 family protein
MSTAGSVTHWIGQLKTGDRAAAQELWEEYFERLVRCVRKKLAGLPRRAADEEDVALSAFDSFCRRAEQGRFPKLCDRDDFWHLLVVIVERKAIDLIDHERRHRRGGGMVRGESALAGPGRSSLMPGMERILGQKPAPEFAAQIAEECEDSLQKLGDEQLRSVALWKMERFTNGEIAAKLGCVPRTVERKLRTIRHLWGQETSP